MPIEKVRSAALAFACVVHVALPAMAQPSFAQGTAAAMDEDKGNGPLPTAIDPKAKAIHDRAVAEAGKLGTVEMTTLTRMVGHEHDAAIPAESKAPARVVIDFASLDAPGGTFPPHLRIERTVDGKPFDRCTYDGQAVLVIDEVARTFRRLGSKSEWQMGIGMRGMALPQWYFENRLDRSKLGPDARVGPPTAMAVVGEETVDGVPCDLVTVVRMQVMPAEAPAGEAPWRMVETIAVARTDGLPRRVDWRKEKDVVSNGVTMTMPSPQRREQTFSAIRPNIPLTPATFDTSEPQGYANARATEPPSNAGCKVKAGDAAPDFRLKDLAGTEFSLAALRGKVVLLDFWATWCGPCKAAMPSIQKIHEEYAAKGVVVLGVNTWERAEGAAAKFLAEKKYTYPCLLGGDDLATSGYGATAIPTMVVIGKDGKVELLEVGFRGDDGIRAAIEAALAK